MRVTFIGATRRTGKARKTGNDYDICQLFYGLPVQPSTRPDNVFTGTGYTVQDIDLCPDALASFNEVEIGQEIELLFAPKPSNPRISWVAGFTPT